jgi:nitrite reductase/ring-hydroxylating ferredoxin subunit
VRDVCGISEISETHGKELVVETAEGPMDVALFRAGEAVRAYRNVCPHQGRSLSFAPDEFLIGERGELVCPHHGASFDLLTGDCLSGPCAGAQLTPVAVQLVNGRVLIE